MDDKKIAIRYYLCQNYHFNKTIKNHDSQKLTLQGAGGLPILLQSISKNIKIKKPYLADRPIPIDFHSR